MLLPEAEIIPFPARAMNPYDVRDLRFRRLIGEEAWAELPEAVRTRFSKRLGGGRTVVYTGDVVECRMNAAGRCCRSFSG